MRYPVFLLLVFAFLFPACKMEFRKPTERMNALNQIQQTDVDFSNRSREIGMKKAFLEYMEDDGILLRKNRLPIVGADAVDFISSIDDSSFVLTWDPGGADISESSDLGFTYGVYTLKTKDTTFNGTYVTIWRRQQSGKWKFVLDSGNEGIGEDKRTEENK
ncbi:MAG: hypothetical protein C5B52_14430 [Bacteroidetes bacterium]|nr:MAG: hypothetical protein C5B52_14430 [Bacteroidota bacterium]